MIGALGTYKIHLEYHTLRESYGGGLARSTSVPNLHYVLRNSEI